jgi:hypothetical protein
LATQLRQYTTSIAAIASGVDRDDYNEMLQAVVNLWEAYRIDPEDMIE